MKFVCLICVALMLGACSRTDIDNKEAVKAAMVEYLTAKSKDTGLDPQMMEIGINAVAFERDVARATVSFTAKGTDAGMQMNYTLDRSGNKWVVRKADATTTGPHPIAGPQSGAPDASPLPPIPLPGQQGKLPAGHPAVPGTTK